MRTVSDAEHLQHARERAERLERSLDEARLGDDERLAAATASVASLQERVTSLEGELTELQAQLASRRHSGLVSLPLVSMGLSAPLAFIAAALFFQAGWWPLGLLGLVATLVAGFAIALEAKGPR